MSVPKQTLETFGMIENADGQRLFLDCVLSEEHTFESDVTEYPVESGSNITDNIRPKSFVLSIEAIVSDSPLDPIRTHRGATFSFAGVSAENFLLKLHLDRQPCTVRVSTKRYGSMAMESLTIKRNKDTGGPDTLFFNAKFKQIRTVTNARTTTSTRGGGGKTKDGPKTPTYRGPKVVLWRKGAVKMGNKLVYKGGEHLIKDSEYVHWVSHEELRARKLPIPNGAGGNVFTSTGQPPGDGAWFHGIYTFTGTNLHNVQPSGPNAARTPLTGEEYERLQLDLKRDADDKIRLSNGGISPIRQNTGTLNKRLTKRPVDLNATNRRPSQTKDTTFTNFPRRGRNAI